MAAVAAKTNGTEKSEERREKDRKAVRTRKINSLKRQINLKEKKLEVNQKNRIFKKIEDIKCYK